MIVQICDMVAIARYLNVTLIVPELDKASFWADPRLVFSFHLGVFVFSLLTCEEGFCSHELLIPLVSEFQDIFDVDHFITSLRDEVRILKELPPRLKQRVENGLLYTMPPISWSDMSYYKNQVSVL